MRNPKSFVSVGLVAAGIVVGVLNVGCAGLRSFEQQGRPEKKYTVKGDGLTPESRDFVRWEKSDGTLVYTDLVQPGLDPATLLPLYTAEDGSTEGRDGLIVDQKEAGPGVFRVHASGTKGRYHGNTAQLKYAGLVEHWCQLPKEAEDTDHGVTMVLNKPGDKNSRCLCFGLILARNEEEYREHMAHSPNAPATLAAFKKAYEGTKRIRTLGADGQAVSAFKR